MNSTLYLHSTSFKVKCILTSHYRHINIRVLYIHLLLKSIPNQIDFEDANNCTLLSSIYIEEHGENFSERETIDLTCLRHLVSHLAFRARSDVCLRLSRWRSGCDIKPVSVVLCHQALQKCCWSRVSKFISTRRTITKFS